MPRSTSGSSRAGARMSNRLRGASEGGELRGGHAVEPERAHRPLALGAEVAGEHDRGDRHDAVQYGSGHPEPRGQVAEEDQRVADVLGQVAVVELALRSDPTEARRGA